MPDDPGRLYADTSDVASPSQELLKPTVTGEDVGKLWTTDGQIVRIGKVIVRLRGILGGT